MKTLLTLLFISFSFCTLGQKSYEGTYYTVKKDRGFESEIFQFKQDGTFSYLLFTCTGIGLGKGSYKVISGDSLQLQFRDCTRCQEKVQITTSTARSDSLEIKLMMKSWRDERPLKGVHVDVTIEQEWTTSNEQGVATLKTSLSNENQRVTVYYIGSDPISINLPPNTSQVTGTMYFGNYWVYKSGDVKTFKILKWTSSTLKLQRYAEHQMKYHHIAPMRIETVISKKMGLNGYKVYQAIMQPSDQ